MDINTVNHISKLNYELRAIRGAMALFTERMSLSE